MAQLQNFTAVIASAATVSGAVFIGEYSLKELFCPVTTGTAITFEVSVDGETWVQYRAIGNTAITLTKTAAAASCHSLGAGLFDSIQYVKVVSGSTEGAARTFTLACSKE